MGQHFAMQEMLSVLVTYLKQTRIEFLDEQIDPQNINARSTLSNHNGMPMRINKQFQATSIKEKLKAF
ncbi:hypothetical protein [Pseudoalteromonas luteoviolacea]|uniref:hypothetical protein n=1 Tax=Pseudoalteromonas luteoviolacea TaxID=43657 RepID=UPI0022AB95DE|nr:hypothetical protein [Pseudoalteromonas luteoviolacea]